MNEKIDKNTVIAIVLSAIVLIGFVFVQQYFFPPKTENVAQSAAAPAQSADTENTQTTPLIPVMGEPSPELSAESIPEATYVITTNKVKVTFTNRGGDVLHYELLNHKDGAGWVDMSSGGAPGNRTFGVSLGGINVGIVDTTLGVSRPDNQTIVFSGRVPAGGSKTATLTKRYTFSPEEYLFKLDIQLASDDGAVLNLVPTAYTLRTAPQLGPQYNPQDKYDRRLFLAYNGQNNKKKTDAVKGGQTKEYQNPFTWIGAEGKYFALLVVPPKDMPVQSPLYSATVGSNTFSDTQVFLPRPAGSGSVLSDSYYVYVGPLAEKSLTIYNNAPDNFWNLGGLRLDESLPSSGFLSFLETALKWGMENLYKVFPNWGVAIIILTLIIKILLFPLTKKSSMTTLKMQEIQPKMQEIQAKYKDTPEKLNAELAKFYKEVGYNPVSGCLPLLIQFPIIIAMFNLFNNYFEFRGAMFISGWIPDLSVGDSIYSLPFAIPFLGNNLRILPIIYVASQLLTSRLMQPPGGGANSSQMKMMTYGMPAVFFFLFYNAPAGLILYWTVSNILQLFQQLVINEVMKKKKAEMAKEAQKPTVFVTKKRKK
jgi:YidC/Oxa1 family membrane protein insertase